MQRRSKAGSTYLRWAIRMWVFLGALTFTLGASAQGGGNVAISGTVTDASGAIVSGAQVKVTQKNTSTVRTAATNNAGQFNFPSLPPTTYTVSVQAQGFKQYVQDVVLLADQIRDLDIHLQVGSETQQITVEASNVSVNTVSQELSQVIESSRLSDLPLNGRNAADLTLLVPGATTAIANNSGTLQGDTKQVPGAEAIAVNGARPDQIGYNLDGANNQDLMSNTNNPFPFPDALQEFSVQTNSFDAQYGNNAGAVVNVVTKSGTNNFHGDLFEFVRNGAFNARNYFAPTVDPLKRNQFGATVGGPIHKNTTFFFFGWQKTIIRSVNNATNAIVPTADNLNGNFSLTNPNTVITNPFTHTPYASNANIGPLDPVALNMAKNLPVLPAGSTNGSVTFGTPLQQNFDEYITRVEQMFRGQDRLFGRFYLNKYRHAPTYDGKDLLTAGPGSTVTTQNWAIGYTWVISPQLVNNTIIDFVRSASDRGQQGGPGGTVPDMKTFGSNIWQLPTAQSGMRNFGVAGDFTLGGFTDAKFIRNTYDLREVLDWNKGKHDMTFGYDLELDQSIIRNTDLENGSFNFTSDVTGLSMASFLLGYQHTFTQTSGDFSDSRENPMGVFFNDKWKVSPRLTLDYGLRWEPQQVMKETRGRIEQFRPDAQAAGVQSAIIPSAPAGLFFIGDKYNGISVPDRGQTGDFNNFAPRVGIVWDPTGSGKMSLRAGGGLFYYSRLPGLFLNDAAISAPFSLRIDLNDSTTGPSQIGTLSDPLAAYPNFTSGFPQRYTLETAPKDATFVKNPTVFSLQPGVKWTTPEIYDWNVTFERQLRADTVMHASYVGTRGTHLRQDVNLNPGVYTAGSSASLQTRRPFQPFAVIYENRNTGANGYNGLQFDLEKRATGNGGLLNQITLLGNYTYSHANDYGLAENGGITDIGSSIGSGMSFYDPRQHAFETGPATFDRRHHVVVSYVWNLPKLTNSNALVRNVIGGWQWTGIYSFSSGDPLTILAGKDRSTTGNNLDRADYVGPAGQLGSRGTPTQCPAGTPGKFFACSPWLDTSRFYVPGVNNTDKPDGQYGNVGKGTYRGPNVWTADTGLIKNIYPFSSHENLNFQFRGEFFNIFNHPQFSDPNTTVANAAFGSIRSTIGTATGNVGTTADSRIIQLALKFNF
ncbi:carboxypeptidase regulatory-like domain-containing protein [Occallatibacter riparius]|uniref:Carboxypeptidase regulatory-like domain-containing protein n=1 Tax=Occallatibacter riparius TaxID=1002689 RepID=A0A9J7BPT0_9BACT|nr:carboxypeptidase regulatory-like domain-containing protein [Occallatibacter riparius]UWZ84607.1 carboxypeptidase regulatory-like domain-containing protein [Occallatibacter riparius]